MTIFFSFASVVSNFYNQKVLPKFTTANGIELLFFVTKERSNHDQLELSRGTKSKGVSNPEAQLQRQKRTDRN